MPLFPDPVRRVLDRIATRTGVTLEDIADALRETEDCDPDERELIATLRGLGFGGEVYRVEDRFYTRKVGGPIDFDAQEARRLYPGTAIDYMIPDTRLSPWLRELGMLIAAHRPNRAGTGSVGHLVWPDPNGPRADLPPMHIAMMSSRLDADPILDTFRWEVVTDRVMTGASPDAGEWTLIYLTTSPPNRDSGPGWYAYGPDVAALHFPGRIADVLNAVEAHVVMYALTRRAQLESQGTGPLVSDELRAAIHAGHVTQVVIFCDRCGVKHRGDFVGETSEERFAAARRFLENRKGWLCEEDDQCPVCRTETGQQ